MPGPTGLELGYKMDFGTDGPRGLAGKWPIDIEGAYRLGMAVGTHFAEPGEHLLLSDDSRESGPHLTAGLAAGIMAVGVNVRTIGRAPTPALSYLIGTSDAKGGVQTSASHNPYYDNGFKPFDAEGHKLTDETQGILVQMVRDGVPPRGFGSLSHNPNQLQRYQNFLVASAGGASLSGMRVVVDSSNGAASGIIQEALIQLKADVIPMFDKPNGRNINEGCGATAPEALQKAVIELGADAGLLVDGDADRAEAVDRLGRLLDGDLIMFMIAAASLSKEDPQERYDGVVATVMTNMGTEEALKAAGLTLHRTEKIGDRAVLADLARLQAQGGKWLGGEQSGHIIIPKFLMTGDGSLGGIQTLLAAQESGIRLDQWRDKVEPYPQALVNISLDSRDLLERPGAQSYITEVTKRFDGKGRLVIRPSGTQPLARVMVEVKSLPGETPEQGAARVQGITEEIAQGLQGSLTK